MDRTSETCMRVDLTHFVDLNSDEAFVQNFDYSQATASFEWWWHGINGHLPKKKILISFVWMMWMHLTYQMFIASSSSLSFVDDFVLFQILSGRKLANVLTNHCSFVFVKLLVTTLEHFEFTENIPFFFIIISICAMWDNFC